MIGFDDETAITSMMAMYDEEQDEMTNCPGHDFEVVGVRHNVEQRRCKHCPKLLVTQELISMNLYNALEGGHDCRAYSVEDICNELLAYSEDCETATADEIRPFVEVWKAAQNG